MNADKVIRECKYYIDNDKLDCLKDEFENMTIKRIDLDKSGYHDTKPEYRPNFEYVFQKVYLHACLKKKLEFIEYLKEVYETFGEIEKMALRHTFIYGKYLLKGF